MSDDFQDIIERISQRYDGIAADNTDKRFSWALNVSWDEISLDNPLVQKAVTSAKFKQYFNKWYANWPQKTIDGKVECFEAALISFIGYLFKSAIEKLSNGEVEVKDFTCNADDGDLTFDYISCLMEQED